MYDVLPLEVIVSICILKLSFIASIFAEWVFSDTNSTTFMVGNDLNQGACFYNETSDLRFCIEIVKHHPIMDQTDHINKVGNWLNSAKSHQATLNGSFDFKGGPNNTLDL